MSNEIPKTFPAWVRITLAVLAIILISITFKVMSHLTTPSVYVNAIEIVKAGPKSADNISHLAFLNFKNYLYLVGPITSAHTEQASNSLFLIDQQPVLAPSTFMDPSGALEILAKKMPITGEDPTSYQYEQPYHMLGWRVGPAGFSLFAIGQTQTSLLNQLEKKAKGWKSSLFIHGLILAFLVMTIFWLLNMSLLSTPYLETVQLLIVNLVFLVLFYSVLVLSGYPLVATIMVTIKILLLANLIFVPISLFIKKKKILN